MRRSLLLLAALLALTLPGASAAADDDLVVVAHATVPSLDLPTLQRLYMGRAVEVGGRPLFVVNLVPGHPARALFFARALQQAEDQYRAYWTVRRHVGKGVPPAELRDAAAVQAHVQRTVGAVGYVLARELKPGVKVVARP